MRKTKMQDLSNPRGTIWANDKNKMGYKMLEKMGWSEGKGLGKDEQGITEMLRSKQLAKQRGLGYENNLPTHYDALENVLSNLNTFNSTNTDNNATNEPSLEEEFIHSKSTFRYKKFAQSKDVRLYNEEDLACILGTKRLDRGKDTKENANHDGIYTISRTSLKDFFEEKMEQIRKKREEGILGGGQQSLDSNITIPDLDFEPAKTEFSFDVSTIETPDMTVLKRKKDDREETRKSKKKKNRKEISNMELKDGGDARVKEEKCRLSESESSPLSVDKLKTSNEDDCPSKGRRLGKVKKFISTVTLGQEQHKGKSDHLINSKTENEMLSGPQNLAPNCIIPDLEFEPAKKEISFDVSTSETLDITVLKRKKKYTGEETRKKNKKEICDKQLKDGNARVKKGEKYRLSESESTLLSVDKMKTSNEDDCPSTRRLLGKIKKLVSTVTLGQKQQQSQSEEHLIDSKTKNEILSGAQNLAPDCNIPDLETDIKETRKIKKKKSKKGICNKEFDNGGAEIKERERSELNQSYTEAIQLNGAKANVERQFPQKGGKILHKMKKFLSADSLSQGRHYDKLEGATIDLKEAVNPKHGSLETAKCKENSEDEVINHEKMEIKNLQEQKPDLKRYSSRMTVFIKKQKYVIDVNELFPGSNLALIEGYEKVDELPDP